MQDDGLIFNFRGLSFEFGILNLKVYNLDLESDKLKKFGIKMEFNLIQTSNFFILNLKLKNFKQQENMFKKIKMLF